MSEIVKQFGFDPTEIGNRYRSHWIEDADSLGEDAEVVPIGSLCVKARDGGSNPIDSDATAKLNFLHTREDDFDCTYRYYWFRPLQSGEFPDIEAMAAEIQRLSTALENARKDALEEAAKAAEAEAERVGQLGPEGRAFWQSHPATAMITASNLAAAIRSLTPPTEKAT